MLLKNQKIKILIVQQYSEFNTTNEYAKFTAHPVIIWNSYTRWKKYARK